MAGGRGITRLQAKTAFTWLNSLNCDLYNSKCQRIYIAKLMANIASLLCDNLLLLYYLLVPPNAAFKES